MPPRLPAPLAAGGSSRTVRVAFRDFAAYAFHPSAPQLCPLLHSRLQAPSLMVPLQAAPPAPRAPLDHTPAPQVLRACAYVIEWE
jgi:hypothetical protein